jgi:hypothetical protein
MKKLIKFCSILIILSCSKNEEKPFDESIYYDKDADCALVTNPLEYSGGNCCDVDGRILVVPNNSYAYTYKGIYSNSPNMVIEWKVISGSINLVKGQNTSEATFKFGQDFTTGKITAIGEVTGGCCECQNTIDISKI